MSRPLSSASNVKARLVDMLRLEAAIRNISEGICMFDAEKKLVICNERYATIYNLPPELTEPGASHASIVEYRLGRGMQPIGTERFLDRHEELFREGKAGFITVTLGNGRIISIHHQPTADGGWVATHRDITEEVAKAKELELQHLLVKSALNNMRQGLCMFDADKRLVVSNRRYAEIYNIAYDARRSLSSKVRGRQHPDRRACGFPQQASANRDQQ
jgi:PAS domain-containing protein